MKILVVCPPLKGSKFEVWLRTDPVKTMPGRFEVEKVYEGIVTDVSYSYYENGVPGHSPMYNASVMLEDLP